MSRWRLILVALLIAGCTKATHGKHSVCNEGACSGHGRCVVENGRPHCQCDPAYANVGLTCVANCLDVSCSDRGGCVVVENEPLCVCDQGYWANGLECLPGPPQSCAGQECSGHGVCVETENEPAYCICEFEWVPFGLTCVPANCRGNNCSGHGTCIDEDGAPRCRCDPGYETVGLGCVPGDCSLTDCSGHGACVDEDGPARCICDHGYLAVGLECRPEACADEDCSNHGACVEGAEGLECLCDPGYTAEGLSCRPQCVGLDCGNHGICIQYGSEARCVCDPGYEEMGQTCVLDGGNVPDGGDLCPDDPHKMEPGQCGCGNVDTDDDGDGTANCLDECAADREKTHPGICGCGVSDGDRDSDGTPDCADGCPDDESKTEGGECGCGVADHNSDGDDALDCVDVCPLDASKSDEDVCGCGEPDHDGDDDGVMDCHDLSPRDPTVGTSGNRCDCDSDSDGLLDCDDQCPGDPGRTGPSDQCDDDSDGTANIADGCPNDPTKTLPGQCGCGVVEGDSDGDGICNGVDQWPGCDDTVDEDGDGVPAYVLDYVPTGAFYVVGCDCDDTNPAVFPGAIEICGGTDDNCNGLADEPGELGAYFVPNFLTTIVNVSYWNMHVTGLPGVMSPEVWMGAPGGVAVLTGVWWFQICNNTASRPGLVSLPPGNFRVRYRFYREPTATRGFDFSISLYGNIPGCSSGAGVLWPADSLPEGEWAWSPPFEFGVGLAGCRPNIQFRNTNAVLKDGYRFDGYAIRPACETRTSCYDGDQNSIDSCSEGECTRACTTTTELATQGGSGGMVCADAARHCPDGYVATGLHQRLHDGGVSRIELLCREALDSESLGEAELLGHHRCGGTLGFSTYQRCTERWSDGYLRGVLVRLADGDESLHSVGATCGRLSDPNTTWDLPPVNQSLPYTELPHQECPEGELAYGLNIRFDETTNSLQLLCNARLP